MSRVEFTRFFITKTFLLVFLLKKCSYFARIFKKMSYYEEFAALVILNIPCQHQTLHQPAFVWWTPNSTFPQSCLSPSTAKDVAKGRPPDSCLAHTSLLSATCVWSQTNWKIIYLQWIVQIKDTKQQNLRGLNPVGMNSSYRVYIIDLMIHPLMCKTWNQLHLR